MTEFTSKYKDKEIVFTKDGIRYNNQVYIKYDDMEEVTINDTDLVFRYKGHLVRMPFNPGDASSIEPFFTKPEPMPTETFNVDIDRFSYLDQPPVEEKPKKKKKKKGKTGLYIGIAIAAVAVIAALLIILL